MGGPPVVMGVLDFEDVLGCSVHESRDGMAWLYLPTQGGGMSFILYDLCLLFSAFMYAHPHNSIQLNIYITNPILLFHLSHTLTRHRYLGSRMYHPEVHTMRMGVVWSQGVWPIVVC